MTLPVGPSNAEIVNQAYLLLGVSDALFGRTDEEMAAGILLLRSMMGEWPFDRLVYDFTSSTPSAASDVGFAHMTAVAASLAERIASATGKQLPVQTRRLRVASYSKLCAAVAVLPDVQFPRNTLAGAGHRRIVFLPSPGSCRTDEAAAFNAALDF